jgi:hypothetical protein
MVLGLAFALALVAVARSGHELPVYPSYYPHEIEIAAIAPERAATLLRAGKLHAYVGEAPGATGDGVGAVEFLGAFVIVTLNPSSLRAKDETTACATAAALLRDMTRMGIGFVAHPYPVTPWHGDYLYHADRADAARQRFLGTDREPEPGGFKVRASSTLARALVRPDWLSTDEAWDATVEDAGAAELVARETVALNGWLGPRWTRSGWFHAYRLLAPAVAEPALKTRIEADVERLRTGAYASAVDRINVERELVWSLQSGCRALVAGYTVKREYFNVSFSAGIENIGFDALEGFTSPMFLRTVKLKDFPWNGWLQLGIEQHPAAAWNPVGGFTDPFGRLMWFAVADPAAIPSPYEHTWTLNRFSDVEAFPRR